MGTDAISPLRQRMIEDMSARRLHAGAQKSHIRACKRFATFLKRSPDTATADDIRRFQLHLTQSGVSICLRNRTMTALRFLFRVTLRRLDLAAEIYHIKEPQKIELFGGLNGDEAHGRALLISAVARMALIAVEQGVAEADHRLRRGAGLGREAECGQRGDGGQYSNCMIADEPSGGGGILGGGRLRHQHLEGERGERPRRHDQELLAIDQALRIAEQALVQRVCAAQVEGERLAHRIVGFGGSGPVAPQGGRRR